MVCDKIRVLMKVAVIGLGEAGSHFANDLAELGVKVSGWDPELRYKLHPGVSFADSNPEAIRNADIILSVNYASESKAIAKELVPHLEASAVYCEMNTSAPSVKMEVEKILLPSGVRFVDMAIMAPVPGKGIKVPLLVSGPGAHALAEILKPYQLNLTIHSAVTGEAAEKKLLRSIIFKGISAVLGEAIEAGEKTGKQNYVRSQIKSILACDDEMIEGFVKDAHLHARRRKDEMEAVQEMLKNQGSSYWMTNGTIKNLEQLLN
jgi:3-hydroxyisobutyrate dehydrogenase-like beta-hydroxyacid dehydrogenase